MSVVHFCRTETEVVVARHEGWIMQLDADVEKPHEKAIIRFIDWPGDPLMGGVQVTWVWEE